MESLERDDAVLRPSVAVRNEVAVVHRTIIRPCNGPHSSVDAHGPDPLTTLACIVISVRNIPQEDQPDENGTPSENEGQATHLDENGTVVMYTEVEETRSSPAISSVGGGMGRRPWFSTLRVFGVFTPRRRSCPQCRVPRVRGSKRALSNVRSASCGGIRGDFCAARGCQV